MRPVGDIFIDNGVEIEVETSDGETCVGCYYYLNNNGGCSKNWELVGLCANDDFEFIVFKKHIRKTTKLDLTE